MGKKGCTCKWQENVGERKILLSNSDISIYIFQYCLLHGLLWLHTVALSVGVCICLLDIVMSDR